MAEDYLKVETMEPGRHSEQIVQVQELVKRFPQFTGIVDHPKFWVLDYTIDNRRIRITYHQDGGA